MKPITKSVHTNKYNFDMEVKYTSTENGIPGGSTVNISITIPYNQFKTFHMPEHCSVCPAGYCTKANPDDESCGRNIPWTGEDYNNRPESCRLSKADILEIIAENL